MKKTSATNHKNVAVRTDLKAGGFQQDCYDACKSAGFRYAGVKGTAPNQSCVCGSGTA